MKNLMFFIFFLVLLGIAGVIFIPDLEIYKEHQVNWFNSTLADDLEQSISSSYLYESSNLKHFTAKHDLRITVDLKEACLYNPQDSWDFCSRVAEEYLKGIDTLNIFKYYNLKTMDIGFYVSGRREFGEIYYFHKGKLENYYENVKLEIFTNDNKKTRELVEKREALTRKQYIIEQEKIAFGQAMFGDSRKQVWDKFAKHPAISGKRWSENNINFKLQIKNQIYKIMGLYHNDELYLVNIAGNGYWENQYSGDFKKNWQALVDFFEKEYGALSSNFLESNVLKEGMIEWTHTWKIGKKVINVGISKVNSKYHAVAWIADKPVLDKINQQ